MSELFEKYSFECYDIETMYNCHTFVSYNYTEDKWYHFEVSSRKNQIKELYKHLLKLKYNQTYMVGFNNIGFDYPVIDFIIKNYNRLKKMDGADIAIQIHEFADQIIQSEERNQFAIWGNRQEIKQIDLMRLWSFTNKARMTSLKMLEFVMRMDNIEELPFSPYEWLEDDQIQLVLDYNFHDVKATTEFFKRSFEMLEVRYEIGNKYDTNLLSVGDVQMGEKIFRFELEKKVGKDAVYTYENGVKTVKTTPRDLIHFKDIIFPYVNFKSEPMKELLSFMERSKFIANQDIELTPKERMMTDCFPCMRDDHLGNLKSYMYKHVSDKDLEKALVQEQFENGEFEFQILGKNGKPLKKPKCLNAPKGMKSFLENLKENEPNIPYIINEEVKELNIDVQGEPCIFGLGGVHYCVPAGIYSPDEEYVIIDSDVEAYYPKLAVKNGMYPEHLSSAYVEVNNWGIEERKRIGKKTPIGKSLKLMSNSGYGKSSDEFSFLYDKRYTYQTTVNGQLTIMMLVEKICQIENIRICAINSDGASFFVPRSKVDEYMKYSEKFEKETNMILEHTFLNKACFRDVNNFLIEGSDVNEKTGMFDRKLKGAYEYDINKDYNFQPHKNHSNFASIKAAEAFILDNIPIKEFLENHLEKGIKDFNNKELSDEERKEKLLDFCLRTKVPRKGSLFAIYDDKSKKLNNLTRYFISKDENSPYFIKRLPLTEKVIKSRNKSIQNIIDYNNEIIENNLKRKLKELPSNHFEETHSWNEWGETSIESGYKIEVCSNIKDADWSKLNLDYYIEQTKKICEPLKEKNIKDIPDHPFGIKKV